MDKSRELCQYEEEKGVTGFIFVFLIMLVLFEPLYSIIFMYLSGRAFNATPIAGNILKFCEAGYLLLLVLTCVSLYKIPRHAIQIAKSYLVVRFIFLTSLIIINYNYTIHGIKSSGMRLYPFGSTRDILLMLLIIPLIYVSVFSIGWFIFLIQSKAVKKNYHHF